MNKQEATYFLEGFTVILAAPNLNMAKRLFALMTYQFGITRQDLDEIRSEIDLYLDLAETIDEEEQAQ